MSLVGKEIIEFSAQAYHKVDFRLACGGAAELVRGEGGLEVLETMRGVIPVQISIIFCTQKTERQKFIDFGQNILWALCEWNAAFPHPSISAASSSAIGTVSKKLLIINVHIPKQKARPT